MSPPRFDRIVVVDWSARSTPTTGTDSIWIAVVEDGRCTLTNPSTRRDASDELLELFRSGRPTLIGVDFSLGFPAGTAELAGLGGVPWAAMWTHLATSITDDDRNRNNRFVVADAFNAACGRTDGAGAGPLWGCPPAQATATLTATKPPREPSWPAEWRLVEQQLRAAGRRPFSCWQLLGAGAVGSQSLMGIAALERLRRESGAAVAVWPFTTGLGLPAAVEVVVAEVWPSLWDVTVPSGVVKDAAQVESTGRRLATLDAAGDLAALFAPAIDAARVRAVVEEEGWVLGVDGRGG